MTDAPGGAGRRQVGLRRRGSRRVRPGGAGEMCRHQEQTRPPPPAAKGRGCSLPSEGGREEGCSAFFFLFSPGWLSRRRRGWKKSELLLLLVLFLFLTCHLGQPRTDGGRERVCVWWWSLPLLPFLFESSPCSFSTCYQRSAAAADHGQGGRRSLTG